MKTQETTIKVLKKEHKTGVSTSGRSWEMDEYTVEENLEREDGSVSETKVVVSTSQAVGDLEVGAMYKVVIFITSRETEKDGKTSIWNSFRITRAEKISDAPKSESEVVAAAVADDIPF